jgi:hypothetical protein
LLTAEALTAAVPAAEWQVATVLPDDGGPPDPAADAGGPRPRLACRVRVHRSHGDLTGPPGWLIGARPLPGEAGDAKWWFAWGLDEEPLERQLQLGHARWTIERFPQDGTQELGLGDDQGRTWPGRHRHLVLVCLVWGDALRRATTENDPPEPAAFSPYGQPAARPAAGAGLPRRHGPLPPLPNGGPAAHARRRPLLPTHPLPMTPK